MAQPSTPEVTVGRYSSMATVISPSARSRSAALRTNRPVRTASPEAPPVAVLTVLLPIFNEEATLQLLLDKLLSIDPGVPFEVVAVNDASSDRSGEILANCHDPRLTVITHLSNRGKGAAVQTALASARGDVTVIQDADLEYDPEQLRALIAPVVAGETDVVYGSRFLGSVSDMRRRNRMANHALTWLTRLLYRTTITDMETCYKVIRRDIIADLHVEAQRFDMEPEITARLIRRGHHILELPIAYEGRTHDDGKKIGYADGIEAVVTLIRWRFRSNP